MLSLSMSGCVAVMNSNSEPFSSARTSKPSTPPVSATRPMSSLAMIYTSPQGAFAST